MLCRDLMKTKLVSCKETDSVRWCAQLMKDWDIGFLPVVGADGKLEGVVTDRDLVIRVLAEGKSPATEARAAMTGLPVVCRPGDSIRLAEDQMAAARKSRLPVIGPEGVCVGVISLSDIAQSEGPRRSGQLLRDVTRRESPGLPEIAS